MADVKPLKLNSGIISQMGSGDTLPVANGGTGATTLTAHGVLLGNGTGVVGATAEGATGEVLVGVTGGNPVFGAWLPQAAAKTADESVTGSTTFQSDDHLLFTGVAGATYWFSLNLKIAVSASYGFKWKWSLPTGASGKAIYSFITNGTTYTGGTGIAVGTGTGHTTSFSSSSPNVISGYITFGDAGTANFQWASNVAGTATVIYSGSNLSVIRIS